MLSFGKTPAMEYHVGTVCEADDPQLKPYERWILENEKEIWREEGPDVRRVTGTKPEEFTGRITALCLTGFGRKDLACVNEAILSCTSEYTILYDDDIRFSPDAFSVISRCVMDGKKPDFIYCDEDRIDPEGVRTDPFFKPGWSPDTLMSFLYVGRAGVFRTCLLKKLGGLRSEYGTEAYYDLVLRFTEKARMIRHIPKVLYHVFTGCEERARDPQAQIRVKQDALKRRGTPGEVFWNEDHEEADVRYQVQGEPLVSIIIPSKDHYQMLSECLESIREHTCYPHYELIIVDNGSGPEQKEKIEALAKRHGACYLWQPMPFNFSAMCNLGARKASGEYLLFLNDDVLAGEDSWLSLLLAQAQLPHCGAVGAKLLYPDTGKIQHAGIVNLEVGAVHALMGREEEKDWYFHRNKVTYNYCAVTGACLMVSREKYTAAGEMDERLSISYNDVGLCFALMEKGYHNCVRNDAVLRHHESASRGSDFLSGEKMARLARECRILYRTFPGMRGKDPCYNRNLTGVGNDFALNMVYKAKPSRSFSGPLPPSEGRIVCILNEVETIGRTWIISGYLFTGRIDGPAVDRVCEYDLILEEESGACRCFRIDDIREDDTRFVTIEDKKGQWNIPYTLFRIRVGQSQVRPDVRYEIVLGLKRPDGRIDPLRTGYYLTAQEL